MTIPPTTVRCSLLLLALLLLSGCDDVLVTAKLAPIQDDRVVGVWANPEDPTDLGVIEKSGNGYAIRPTGAGEMKTQFTLSRAGSALFAQIEEKCADHVFSFRGDERACYLVVRLEVDDNSLTFLRLDPEIFRKNPEVNVEYRIATSHPRRGDSVTCALVESPAPEVLAFLGSLPADSYKPGTRMARKE